MSLAATCWWTLARSVVLCLIAWPVCCLIERAFQQQSVRWRPWLLVGILAPFCLPELMVGYAFRDIAMAHPTYAEALCCGLLLMRLIPVGAVALLVAPPSAVDASGLYCRWLLCRSKGQFRRQAFELARSYWNGPFLRALPALAIMSIVAFQEFELAALLQTKSWTDWFVTAQRLGLEQREMLRQSLWPLAMQAPVLFGVLLWLRAQQVKSLTIGWRQDLDPPGTRHASAVGMICVIVALIIGCLIPLGLVGWRAFEGLSMLLRQRSQLAGLTREMVIAASIAVSAGILSWVISGRMSGGALNVLILGLFGSLLLSLGCVGLFQVSFLRPLYDTPFPWGLALIAWLLPRAALLRLWLQAWRDNEAIHLAKMLAAGDTPAERSAVGEASPGPAHRGSQTLSLLWHLRDQPQFLAIGLLCYWAYCDLPTAYMLAPTGMASGLVRLYNFMHFGRSAAVSAESIIFFGVPVICFALILVVNRKLR